MVNLVTYFSLLDPYGDGVPSLENDEYDFSGQMCMFPNLFMPFPLTNFFFLSWKICIEQCNWNRLVYEPWHPSGLVITSELEANYFDISYFCPQLWPKYKGEGADGWGKFPPWYLLQITEEEYNSWDDPYVGGDFGNLGFTHAIGIQHKTTVMRW